MQLLIILALLLYGGNAGARQVFEEVKPVLEDLGGEEMKQAFKNAEEISQVLSAVSAFGSELKSEERTEEGAEEFSFSGGEKVAFPLKPINNIANSDVICALSRYIESDPS